MIPRPGNGGCQGEKAGCAGNQTKAKLQKVQYQEAVSDAKKASEMPMTKSKAAIFANMARNTSRDLALRHSGHSEVSRGTTGAYSTIPAKIGQKETRIRAMEESPRCLPIPNDHNVDNC